MGVMDNQDLLWAIRHNFKKPAKVILEIMSEVEFPSYEPREYAIAEASTFYLLLMNVGVILTLTRCSKVYNVDKQRGS